MNFWDGSDDLFFAAQADPVVDAVERQKSP
jgi:hypothetical protein